MGLLIRNTDFVGTYEIAQTQNSKLTYYIDRYETLYLKRILGNDLFDLFEADITNYVPTTPIYENIYNPLVVYYSVGFGQTEAYRSEGLKQVLLNLIYFEFMRDISFNASATGLVVNQNEVSTPAVPHMIYRKYNDAVNSIDAIQMYINQNSADYPDYKGENFVLNSPHF